MKNEGLSKGSEAKWAQNVTKFGAHHHPPAKIFAHPWATNPTPHPSLPLLPPLHPKPL